MRSFKKTLIQLICSLVLVLVLAPKLDVHADGEWKTVYSDAFIRSGPGTNYSISSSVCAGEQVKVYGLDGNGWYHLSYNGMEGYSYYELIDGPGTPEDNAVASLYDSLYTTTDLNLRSGPNKTFTIVGVVPGGTKVYTEASDGGWFKVTYQGKTGWLSGKYLADSAGEKPIVADGYISPVEIDPSEYAAGASEGDPESVLWTTVDCYMRKGPAKSHQSILVIPANTKLRIYDEKDLWYETEYNGKSGFVSGKCLAAVQGGQALVDANGNWQGSSSAKSYAGGSAASSSTESDSAPEASLGTYQVVGAPDGLNVRTAPNSGASVVGLLPNGSKIAVFKQVGDWYQVFYKSNQYYCYGGYLKKVQ